MAADLDLSPLIPLVTSALGVGGIDELESWTVGELYGYASDELDRLTGAHNVVVECAELEVAAGGPNVAYPADRLGTLAAFWTSGATVAALRPASVRELEAREDDWEAAAGEVTHYVEDFQGADLFRLYKQPAAPGTATLLYLAGAEDLSESQTRAPIPAPIGDALALRMIAEARRKDCDAQLPEAAAFVEQVLGLYESALSAYWGEGF